MTAEAVAVAVTLVLAWLGAVVVPPAFVAVGLGRANFEGRLVPTACGILLLPAAVAPATALSLMYGSFVPHEALFIGTALYFALLGLVDDIWGSRSVRGLKGHLRMLMRGSVTTGAVKAVGGSVGALAVGFAVQHRNVQEALLNALLVAMCANALNLLDTRPARAGTAYVLFTIPLLVLWPRGVTAPALPALLLAAVLAYLPAERRRRAMMGDAGSNMLGAVLGLYCAVVLSVPAKIGVGAALVWLHAYTEKHSLTEAIEKRPLLAWLDHALRG